MESNTPEATRPDPTQLLIADLAGKVAKAETEASGWKIRASLAEEAVAQLEAALEELRPVDAEDDADLEESYGGTE